MAAYSVWYNIVRPIAVGTMLVGACHTLFSMRDSIVAVHRRARSAHRPRPRTKASITSAPTATFPFQWLVLGTSALIVPITVIYYYFAGSWLAAIVAAVVMTVAGFLLSAVGGYLVGLVGSSNQPLSGLTLSALVIAALVMLAIGVKGLGGVAAVLGVAAWLLRLLRLRLADSGSEGRPPARRHALEDAGGGDRGRRSCSRCS